ncbi:hypothetical protein GR28A_00034 [Vibrio phage vB_VcorM_GR28A]|nr:hypothetical protein GR28A_00034 [Vibrio phage vB_VcorM_GR28A]
MLRLVNSVKTMLGVTYYIDDKEAGQKFIVSAYSDGTFNVKEDVLVGIKKVRRILAAQYKDSVRVGNFLKTKDLILTGV